MFNFRKKSDLLISIVFWALLISLGRKVSSHKDTRDASSTHAHTTEEKLVRRLMRPYERSMRPVFNHTQTVTVRMSSTLSQVVDVVKFKKTMKKTNKISKDCFLLRFTTQDLRQQKIITTVWLDHEWVDERLRWNPDDYAGIKVMRLPHPMVWLPDVVLYNSADDKSSYQDSLVIVSFDGTVFWPPIVHLHSFCRMDVTYFPYDDQFFYLKFGSWSHSGDLVNVEIRNAGVDLSNYIPNGEWDLVEVKATRNVVYYPCCPEPFPDLTFYFHIRRRLLYYLLNIILPTATLSALALLSFFLPPHCSEKVTLSLTVLLAYTVFLMTVSENLPRTSEFLPIFSVFITLVMTVTAASTVCSIFVIQVRFRGRTGKEPPVGLLLLARRGITGSIFRVIRRAVWMIVSCASCRLYPIGGAASEDDDNSSVALSVASPGGETGISRHSSLFDPTEPLSMSQPKGLGVGRDEQEFLFTVIDEWDGDRPNISSTLTDVFNQQAASTMSEDENLVWQHRSHHHRSGRNVVGRRFAKHTETPPLLQRSQSQQSKNSAMRQQQQGGFISYLNSLDGSCDENAGDEDDDFYDNLMKNRQLHQHQNRQGNLDAMPEGDLTPDYHSICSKVTALSEGAVPLKRGTRKRILAYKRSPLWDRSNYLCKENASRYERNLTAMLRTLAKQHRYENREVALEKLWTEVSVMLNRCFLTLFLFINFAAILVVLVIIPYAKHDVTLEHFITSRNLANHTINSASSLSNNSMLLNENDHDDHDVDMNEDNAAIFSSPATSASRSSNSNNDNDSNNNKEQETTTAADDRVKNDGDDENVMIKKASSVPSTEQNNLFQHLILSH